MSGPRSVSAVLVVEDRREHVQFIGEIVRAAFGDVDLRSARTLEAARSLFTAFAPDLVILDLNLPDGAGATLIPSIREAHGDVSIVAMTVFDDDEHLFTALQHGADGYVLKDESRTGAAAILREVLAGRPPLSARIARRILRHAQSSSPREPATPTLDLTPREREVLGLLSQGHTALSAGAVLGISEETIKTHVKGLYRKLDVSSRASLVRTAIDKRLV